MAVISTRRRIQPAGVMMWWMMLLLLLIGTAATASSSSTRQVLFVAKNRQNPFFISAWEGCVETAHKLTLELQTNNKNNNNNIESEQEQARIECIFLGGDNGDDAQEQADLVRTYLLDLNTNNTNNTDSDTTILGMALSVIDIDTATSLIDEVVQDYNIPVVTYDSDAPDSLRHAYIGTDNWKFGNELAKLLLQLRPQGGVYGVISAQAPGVEERVRGLTDRFTNSIQQSSSVWKAAPNSPRYCQDNATLALQQSRQFAQEGVDAIIAVGGWPMYIVDGWERLALDYADNLTTVVGDAFDIQVRALRLGHVNALLGQMPFQMGQIVMTTLWDRHQTNTNGDDDDDDDDNSDIIYTTSFLEMLQVPLILPPLTVDLNYLGGLAGLGYFYLVVIWSLCIATVLWTFVRRQDKVVTASQPFFLYLVSGGTAIFGSAILPLTFDDEHHSQATMDRACMTTPWLLSLGFTLTFAALFSKTWRINQIFRNAQKFRRVVVTTKDVLLPLVILLVLNVAVLITWTIQAPLVYVRKAHEGTDPWNRVISTYGTCQVEEDHSSDGSLLQNDVLAYLILLAAINFGCLLMANYQAYAARSVQTEYSESKYIAFIMASNLQVAVVGVPVVFLVKDEPRSHFVVLSSLIFIMSTILLGFMFVPKVYFWKTHQKKDEQEEGNPLRAGQQAGKKPQTGLKVHIVKYANDTFLRGDQRSTALSKMESAGELPRFSSALMPICDENEEDDDDGEASQFLSSSIHHAAHEETSIVFVSDKEEDEANSAEEDPLHMSRHDDESAAFLPEELPIPQHREGDDDGITRSKDTEESRRVPSTKHEEDYEEKKTQSSPLSGSTNGHSTIGMDPTSSMPIEDV